MTLPKHIQEAATPLTDAKKYWCPQCGTKGSSGNERDIDVVLADEFRNLERLTVWQQEVMEKQHKAIRSAMEELSAFGPADEDTEYEDAVIAFNQLQSYLKTLKGEK